MSVSLGKSGLCRGRECKTTIWLLAMYQWDYGVAVVLVIEWVVSRLVSEVAVAVA